MILIDTNILMYANGADHPNKAPAIRFLRSVAEGSVDGHIDAETLQEIIHRYTSLGRWKEGGQVYKLARSLFPDVLAVTGEVMDSARDLVDRVPGTTLRDAVHAAVVLVYRMDGICTFDRDFDRIPDSRCIDPEQILGKGVPARNKKRR